MATIATGRPMPMRGAGAGAADPTCGAPVPKDGAGAVEPPPDAPGPKDGAGATDPPPDTPGPKDGAGAGSFPAIGPFDCAETGAAASNAKIATAITPKNVRIPAPPTQKPNTRPQHLSLIPNSWQSTNTTQYD